MFRVEVSSVAQYLAFDPARSGDLIVIDETVRASAPALRRWFKTPDPAGTPGMQMTMIGYGAFRYTTPSAKREGLWPILGLALQKNHLSLYCSARTATGRLTTDWASRLGQAKVSATGVVTFASAGELDLDGLRAMLAVLDDSVVRGTVALGVGRSGVCLGRVDPPHQQ